MIRDFIIDKYYLVDLSTITELDLTNVTAPEALLIGMKDKGRTDNTKRWSPIRLEQIEAI